MLHATTQQVYLLLIIYEFNSFREGVRKVIYSYVEARFTCKWPNPLQFAQILSYKVNIVHPTQKLDIITTYSMILNQTNN